MLPTQASPDTVDEALERAELEAVLASPLFSRAPSLCRFLAYICEQHFQHRDGELKEYNIAVEALGRPAGFDHTKDSIVRVEAHKLRKRLRQYYDGEGAEHVVRIEIPGGQYAPRFFVRNTSSPKPALAEAGPDATGSSLNAAGRADELETAAASHGKRVPRPALLAGAAVVITLAGGFFALRSPEPFAAVLEPAPPQVTEAIYRISAGTEFTPYVDQLGRTWTADTYFEGGEANQIPDSELGSAPREELYQSWREGRAFTYRLPLTAGRHYEVQLHFAEWQFGPQNPGTGESSRVFDVTANGQRLLREFDILSNAGAPRTPTVRVFSGLSPDADGILQLDFQAISAQAALSGIEVFPQADGLPRPVRILAGDRKSQIIDHAGAQWSADQYFDGGRSVPRATQIRGSDTPNLFAGERYGNFHYRLPVAQGAFTVRLHFAEGWWGAANPGGGGEGSRIFDVLCNGKLVLEDFDVIREAGGENRALVRSFKDVEPNPQGRIEIAFVPKVNYAFVNAIEVIPQAR